MSVAKRRFGATDMEVSILGFGAGQIGDINISDQEVDRLLNRVLDLGITLIDTARGYGASEERIGRFISHRRKEYVLSTKVGYGIPGYHDWTYDCVIAGIDYALTLMKTDYIDIVHLHSCPIETLKYGEVIDALESAIRAGKVRVTAYSGENEALAFAAASHRFKGLMTSVNICDQRSLLEIIPTAKASGIGVIAKRPVANAPWRFPERPAGHYCEEYWQRLRRMNLSGIDDWQNVALRYAAFAEGVSSSIVGTANLAHIEENLKIIAQGPLPEADIEVIRYAFMKHDDNWTGQI